MDKFAEYRAKLAAGEVARGPVLDPAAKAATRPTSLRLAINGKCYDCQGRDSDPGYRGRIRTCSIATCTLHPVRPYQTSETEDAE
jgi:hypothetical protein